MRTSHGIVNWLSSLGHDGYFAADQKPGEKDPAWLRQCESEGRLILTADKDFGELIFRDHMNSHGVILLRMEHLTIRERLVRLRSCWSVVEENASGKFIVISE